MESTTLRVTLTDGQWINTVGRVTIGRDLRAVVGDRLEVPGDAQLSKQHACIELVDGVAMVFDLGSSNGTFVVGSEGRWQVPPDQWVAVPAGAQLEFGNQRAAVDVLSPATGPAPFDPSAASLAVPRRNLGWVVALVGVFVVISIGIVGLVVTRSGEERAVPVDDDRTEQDDETDDDDQESEAAEVAVEPAPDRIGDGRLGESARPFSSDAPQRQSAPPTERWSRSVAGALDHDALAAGELVYVATVDIGRALVVGIDRPTGGERWSRVLLPTDAATVSIIGVVEDVVVVEACDSACTLFGVAADGSELWVRPVDDDGVAVVERSRLYVVLDDEIRLVDVRDGEVVRSVDGDFVSLSFARPVSIVDLDGSMSDGTVYDFDLVPAVGPFRFETESQLAGDFDGATVVVAAEGGLATWDANGDVAREIQIDASWDVVQVVAVSPDFVVIETSSASTHGLDISGDAAVEVWQRTTSVGLDSAVETESGPLLLGERSDDDVFEMVDPFTGEVRYRADGFGNAFYALGENGLAFERFDFDSFTSEVWLVDYATGETLWEQSFSQFVEFADGGGLIGQSDADVYTYFE